jgi:Holliday junction resolvase RusA-like endonuclease
VQKNGMMIMYANPKRRTGAFIGHSKEMSQARDSMSSVLFDQFKKQGGRTPITYPVEVNLVFYVERAHEPDLDNLPAIVCDAMQGIRVKGTKARVAVVLSDDKLVCKVKARKITKGDINYVGEPRTECTVRRYLGTRA